MAIGHGHAGDPRNQAGGGVPFAVATSGVMPAPTGGGERAHMRRQRHQGDGGGGSPAAGADGERRRRRHRREDVEEGDYPSYRPPKGTRRIDTDPDTENVDPWQHSGAPNERAGERNS